MPSERKDFEIRAYWVPDNREGSCSACSTLDEHGLSKVEPILVLSTHRQITRLCEPCLTRMLKTLATARVLHGLDWDKEPVECPECGGQTGRIANDESDDPFYLCIRCDHTWSAQE
jgi:hypothetical protein